MKGWVSEWERVRMWGCEKREREKSKIGGGVDV